MARGLLAVLVIAALGGAIGWRLKPAPAQGPPSVVVDTLWMEKARIDLVKPSLGEKLTTAAVKPVQTRVASAPSAAGRLAVATYCAPTVAVQTSALPPSNSDTTGDVPPVVYQSGSSSALLPDFQGRIQGSRVTLYSTLNDGRRWSADYRPRGHWSFETDGDSVLVTSDRLWVRVARGATRCAPAIGGGSGVGFLVGGREGAAIGAVAAAVGCLF